MPADPDDQAVATLRARLGQEVAQLAAPNLEEATKDGIRHWAMAVGDRDPKWTDESYAASSRFRAITAPPSMLYGFDVRAIGDRSGLVGYHSQFGGAVHEWYRPIFRNTPVQLKVRSRDIVELPADSRGRVFRQESECTFTDPDGLVLARTWPWGRRTKRRAGALDTQYEGLELASYSPDDIEAIAARYAQEQELIRGATVRFWEDVAVGDPLGPLTRGPWTRTTSLNFLQGIGGLFMLSHSFWYEYLRRHPGAGIRNDLGIPEGPIRAHWEDDFARRTGVPAAYNWGPEIVGWLTTACTYWCGDDGWLQRLAVEIHRFNLVGDLMTVAGSVTAKALSGDCGVVDGGLWLRDQRGADTATGTFRIVLPRRDTGLSDHDATEHRQRSRPRPQRHAQRGRRTPTARRTGNSL